MYVAEQEENTPLKKQVSHKKQSAVSAATTITQKYGVERVEAPTVSAIQKPKEDIQIPKITVGDIVSHRAFGNGTVSFMDKAQKKIRVKFNMGEKTFIFPDAFIQGYLKSEK